MFIIAQIRANQVNLPQGLALDSAMLSNVLATVFAAAALISVIFVAIGGFKYAASAGDPNGTAKAKNTIMWALIGLVIVILSRVIVRYVLEVGVV